MHYWWNDFPTRLQKPEVNKERVIIAIIFVGLAFAVPVFATGRARIYAGGLLAVIGVASLLVPGSNRGLHKGIYPS